jgi:hypothetical protein
MIPESFVHVTAVLTGTVNVVVPAAVTKLKLVDGMQNVLAGQAGGGGGGGGGGVM